MAAKTNKAKEDSEVKPKKRWMFDDDMTASLVECLKKYKVDKEGEEIDFEGDLVKLYGDIRKLMAGIYEEDNFGPVEHAAATTDVNEMSKEDYKAFKQKIDKNQKSIKLGYERIKSKVKKLRASFQKAVLESTRSGSGRIIKKHWESLIQIWGGAPGTIPLEYDESSLTGIQLEVENSAASYEERDVLKLCEDEPDNTGVESTIHDDINHESLEENDKGKELKKRKCQTALYVDEKRKKLEKSLSSKQRDNVMLQLMKEDLALKKKSMAAEESVKNADANTMMKIADSMQMLSQAIMTGFNHLAILMCQVDNHFLNITQCQGISVKACLAMEMQLICLTLRQVIVSSPQSTQYMVSDQLVLTVIQAQQTVMKMTSELFYYL